MKISPVYNNNFYTDKKLQKQIKKNSVEVKETVEVKTTLNEDNITKFINKGLNYYK